ncbi:Bromodomain-containing protein 7/9 [Forsythia ovata]|uniref:Bromodomain-containing protein 7/9 n=1 Tax=Forsythia ovata TaxID=205694 RepID=A0ABD1W8D9_9LAMI
MVKITLIGWLIGMMNFQVRTCGACAPDMSSMFSDFSSGADMKYGKKQFTVDENMRDTYKQFHPLSSGNEPPVFSNSAGDMKRLMPLCILINSRKMQQQVLNDYAGLYIAMSTYTWCTVLNRIRDFLPSPAAAILLPLQQQLLVEPKIRSIVI